VNSFAPDQLLRKVGKDGSGYFSSMVARPFVHGRQSSAAGLAKSQPELFAWEFQAAFRKTGGTLGLCAGCAASGVML